MKRNLTPAKRKITLVLKLLFVISFHFASAQSDKNSKNKFTLQDFSLDLNAVVSPQNHLWVTSGFTTVNPKSGTVMGVNSFHSPPIACVDFNLNCSLLVNGHTIKDSLSHGKGDVGLLYAGGKWNLHKIVRNGTYNQIVDDKKITFQVRSTLTPLFDEHGFTLKVVITNRTEELMSLTLMPEIDPGYPRFKPLNNWTFGLPYPGKSASRTTETTWQNDDIAIQIIDEGLSKHLLPGTSDTLSIAVIANRTGEEISKISSISKIENNAHKAWMKRLSVATRNVPKLETNIPGLQAYYNRSLASGLVCIWENDNFIHSPFIATLGIDGGGICAYAWDIGGYNPQILSLMLGEDMLKILNAFGNIDLTKDYAYTLNGEGTGPFYSYSPWSYISLHWAIARQEGLTKESFEKAVNFMEYTESFYPSNGVLFDYGLQHNLLEMRGSGWQHIVASPNAERAWCYERLADMGEYLGYDNQQILSWRSKASVIREAVINELWDESKKWYKSMYPDGHVEYTYSIQAYDAYRAGAFNTSIESELLSHLRRGAFLGEYGVSSISAEDSINYEYNDFDWSGSGAYVGEGPQLALILYEKNQSMLAWDVLKRHFWMGKHLPYFPQEHAADKPYVPAHKRANEISGLTGLEAIIYGLIGFEAKLDGTIWVSPKMPEPGFLNLKGIQLHNQVFDIELTDDAMTIYRNGNKLYFGPIRKMQIL